MGIIRKTKSIDALLNEFELKQGAISVVELIEKLSSKINKTTIYRVLDKLEDDGVVHSFIGLKGIKWYAKCDGCSKSTHVDHHPHFECIKCGKVDCLSLDIMIPSIPNREIISSHIILQGKCNNCLQSN